MDVAIEAKLMHFCCGVIETPILAAISPSINVSELPVSIRPFREVPFAFIETIVDDSAGGSADLLEKALSPFLL